MALIRHPKLTDIPQLLEVERQCFEPEKYDQVDRSWFRYHIVRNQQTFFVAETSDKLVGYISCSQRGKFFRIYGLGVLPEVRRSGVAQELLEAAFKLAKGQILLEVREDNFGARRLYEKLGFTYAGKILGYYADQCTAFKYIKPTDQ